MRRMIGAILRVTVPATIIRSDWRGDARKTPAPKRSMSYRDDTVAIISMAQHASPNVLGQSEEAELLEDDGPGEDEHRLDVEDHEQHRNDIVPHRDLAARVVKDRRAALVGHELGLVGTRGPDEIARQEGTDTEGGGDHQEEEDRQVVLDDQIGHQGVTLSRGEPGRRSGSRRASRKYGLDRKPSSWGADMPLCWMRILYVVPMPSGRSSSRIAADCGDSGSRPAKADSMPRPIRKCSWFVKPVTFRPTSCPARAKLVKSTCAVRSC